MRARWIGIGALGLLYGLVLVLLRGEPILASDQGVYLSVAARMLDGDHLYSETIENKDPLFFYTYAAALWIGGWRGPYLLDGVWLGLAGLSFALLLRELHLPRTAVVAGFLIYPLALTSGWYVAGQSMLGALAVAPLVSWLWLRGRFTLSGAMLAALVLLKLNLAAVAIAPIVAFVAFGAPEGSRRRALARAAAGATGALAGAALVLAVRGELRPYLELVEYNTYYSRALIDDDSFFGRAVQHLDVVVGYFERSGRWQLPAAILVLSGFAVAAALLLRNGERRSSALAAGAAVTLVLALGSLAVTAYWFHHLQMLAYPAALIAATLISAVAVSLGPRTGAIAAALCVVFTLWSSVKNDGGLEISAAWRSSGSSPSSDALEQARTRFYGGAERVTYMAFGGNSENAHAVFISDRFDLVCRWFHLYPHSTDDQLDETTDCSRSEKPMLILVTLGFFDDRAGESWRTFVANARELLDSRYERVVTTYPGFQVWKRREIEVQ